MGKTTLLRSLAGLWPRHQGSAELDRDGQCAPLFTTDGLNSISDA
ncbi:hypothetical protein [Pseudomonas sp. ZS1P83]